MRSIYFLFSFFLFILWFRIRIVMAIVGGSYALDGQLKYQVSVQGNEGHVCGGGIISELHVLTAAQCIIDKNNKFIDEKFWVLGGVVDIDSKTSNRMINYVEKAYVPTIFKRIRDINQRYYKEKGDIAVLKLKHFIFMDLSSPMRKLNLPMKRCGHFVKYLNELPLIAGFGLDTPPMIEDEYREQSNSKQPEIPNSVYKKLKVTETKVLQQRSCKTMWQPYSTDETELCAQVMQPNQYSPAGVCNGDIGSPLVLHDNTVIGVLVGHRPNCNELSKAALYTRVTAYSQFIKDAMKNTNFATYETRFADYRDSSVIEKVLFFSDLVPNPKT